MSFFFNFLTHKLRAVATGVGGKGVQHPPPP